MDSLATSLIEGLDEGVGVVDSRLAVVAWNAAMERLSGTPRDAALGLPAAPALEFLRDPCLPEHLARALAGEVVAAPDSRAEAPRETWLAARYMPWRDASGAVLGAVVRLADVTEARRRAAYLRALEAIGQSLSSSLDLSHVLDTIVHRALELMGAESALVVSWDGESPEFSVMRHAGRLTAGYAATGLIPAGGGPISRAVREGRTIATPDILTDEQTWLSPERRAQIEREGFKAVVAAPLRSKGRIHGALVVHYWAARTFREQDVAVLTLLAEHAALAIDNARVYADATRHAERLRELAEVEQLVSESLEVEDVLQRITLAAARLLAAPVVQLWTADVAAKTLRLQASTVEPGAEDPRLPHRITFGEGVAGRVAEAQAPVYVADVASEPQALLADWARRSGIGHMLSVPILAGENLLGVLAVRTRSADVADAESRALVTSLAARAAVAIQNARLYADAVDRGARLRTLVEVTQSITASLDSTDVMERIVRAAAAIVPGACAALHLVDEEEGTLRAAALSGAEWSGMPLERPLGAGLPGLVAELRRPVLVTEPEHHPRTLVREWWRSRPGSTYYGLPVAVGDTLVGVLDHVLPEGVPGEEEQEALRLLAAQAGVIIRNARLYQAERGQAARIRALAAINHRISGTLDLDDLLRTISASAAQLLGARFVSFWLADDTRRTLTFVGGSDEALTADFPIATATYDHGAVGWVARHREPLVVDDIFADGRMLDPDWWTRWNMRAFVGYPVMAGQDLAAVLVFIHSEPIEVTGDTADIIEMFAAQAGVAVQNARLLREAQRRRDVAEIQARLARDLAGTLDLARVAERVAHGSVDVLKVQSSAVFRHDSETGTLHAIAAIGPEAGAVRGLVLRAGEGVAGRAVEERRPVVATDAPDDARFVMAPDLRQRLRAHDIGVVAVVPLLTRDRVVGALSVGDAPGRDFTPDDVQTLQAFADQAALAFENARLYESARDSLARLRETQMQLVQAAKMSALGQLVSGVAHELNNPLSVIIGYGQLLLGKDLAPPVRRPIELMVAQGDRMAKIVRNLLYFARQRPPERAAVDLHEVIDRTLALRHHQLTVSGISVTKTFAPALPHITGDGQQLEQVFLNLLLNAEQAILEARPAGRIVLRTSLRADAGAVVAEVVDDGPGIPADVTPRVFEPFFTTKTVGMGTGLGLSVSYGIVEQHGGRLSFRSRPGETVFTVELPVTAPADPARKAPTARVALSGTGRTALVVEDEPQVLDLVVTLLGDSGWRVDVARNGREGLDRVRALRYDLVVSDVRMPDGDGPELFRGAVAHDPELARRFVFITGDTANPGVWEFLKGVDVPVIEKPFPPVVFEEAVYRVVTGLSAAP